MVWPLGARVNPNRPTVSEQLQALRSLGGAAAPEQTRQRRDAQTRGIETSSQAATGMSQTLNQLNTTLFTGPQQAGLERIATDSRRTAGGNGRNFADSFNSLRNLKG